MIVLWSTQCPKCGPLLVRQAQKCAGSVSFGETWCALCGEPVTEVIERRLEENEEPMPKISKAKKVKEEP